MNVPLRTHSNLSYRIGFVIFAVSLFAISCSKDSTLARPNSHLQTSGLQSGTPIPLKADSESQGRRCEGILYDHSNLPEENTPEYRRCLFLQRDLNQAAWDGDINGIEEAIEMGATANAGYYQQGDPLRMAITKGRTEAVRLLIENGVDVNAKHKWDATPLHFAAHRNFTEIARILIENGSDICAAAIDDRSLTRPTALDYAEQESHGEMVRLLKAAGADKCP